jgi:deoxyribodipyrimidine photolyase-related protein
MRNLIYIFGDQLSISISSLDNFSKQDDLVLMTEVMEEATYVPHHKKKLIFIISAMRHFAEELKEKGFNVEYVKLDDDKNNGSFDSEISRFTKKYKPEKIIITKPSEYRVLEKVKSWNLDSELEIREDNRFISNKKEFADYAKGKKQILMEFFYRNMRKKTGLLMKTAKEPVGGKWNFDKENRSPMSDDISVPDIPKFEPDEITNEVFKLVEEKFPNNFGESENFFYAVAKSQAEEFFEGFIENRLSSFGEYQDAMRDDLEFGFHSIISLYMNVGLLDPLDCCKRVEKAYRDGKCELNSAEGFIRQIIGWREYIRGIYWHFMPDYKDKNYLEAKNKLPEFYWDESKTEMSCMRQAVRQTRKNAYSHHIQRLMVTGNFALLTGVNPGEINEWYMAVYADAYDWVELPNTHGMAIYADGGIVGSKPYAASGKYINRMSNFCKNCKYKVSKTTGEDACPFNYLYWSFIIKHEDKFKDNHRMRYPYMNLRKKSQKEIEEIVEQSDSFIKQTS